MVDEQNRKKQHLLDYFYILYKWKKFLIISILTVGVIVTVISFLIPKTYRATAVIMLPPESNSLLGGLTGLMSGKSSVSSLGANPVSSLGAKLLGGGSSLDNLFGILNSRTALTNVINKFDLIDYYEISDSNFDKTLKAFKGDISFDQNENGMIEISVINKSPIQSAVITNYFVSLLDSMNIELNSQSARNNREFIEKRYLKNVSDLKLAEDSLYKFQKKYGVLAVPTQLEVTFKASAQLEAELVEKQLAKQLLKNQYGENSPVYKSALEQEEFIREKINSLRSSSGNFSNFLIPFKQGPELVLHYYRYYREIEIQSKIMEVILPLYEQAKVDEQKSIPTITVLDRAVPPEIKYSPKRSLIIIGFTLLFSFFFIITVYRGETAVTREEYGNPLEEKETQFFIWIKKIYKIKL